MVIMYCEINDSKRITSIMKEIGKDTLISAFEEKIGIPWATAKMRNFCVYGLNTEGALYYLDGRYPYGSLVLEFDIELVKKYR